MVRALRVYPYFTQLLFATVLLCSLGQVWFGVSVFAEDLTPDLAPTEVPTGGDASDKDATDGKTTDLVDLDTYVEGHKALPNPPCRLKSDGAFADGRLVLAKADHHWATYIAPHLAAEAPPPQ